LDLVLKLNYFSFSHPNPTYLPKYKFVSPNNQFYQRIWYVEYYSVHAYMLWSQKFRKSETSLDTGTPACCWLKPVWYRIPAHQELRAILKIRRLDTRLN